MRLETNDLHSGYGDLVILHGVTFEARPGEIIAVLGHNGVGKTTLMRTIVGLLRPLKGDIRIDGRPMDAVPPHVIARMGVAYIPQEAALFPDLTVLQNLQVAFSAFRGDFEAACDRALSPFPFLRERYNQRAGTLSGGQQKMLLLARALLPNPLLILADEVTEGVQPSQIRHIGEVLRQLNEQQGTTVILVEQHIGFALEIADRCLVLKQGRISASALKGAEARSVVESQLAL